MLRALSVSLRGRPSGALISPKHLQINGRCCVNAQPARLMSAEAAVQSTETERTERPKLEGRKVIQLKGKTERKNYNLTRLDNVLANSKTVAVLQHNSLTVAQFSELRAALGPHNMKVTMFQNTLTRLALTGTAFEPLRPLFRASSLVIHSPDANVKALSDLVKKHPRVTLLGVHVEGLTLDMEMVKTYLNLPPITQLYGELLAAINQPPRMLAALLQRGSSDLVMNLQRYIDDKKGPGEETSQSEESTQ